MEDTVALLDIEDECDVDGCDEEREGRDCICLGAFLVPPLPDQGSFINIRALHHLGLGLLVS